MGQVLSCLPPQTHLISVGYSSPVNKYTQMKELARQPLPSAAWAVRSVCIPGGRTGCGRGGPEPKREREAEGVGVGVRAMGRGAGGEETGRHRAWGGHSRDGQGTQNLEG